MSSLVEKINKMNVPEDLLERLLKVPIQQIEKEAIPPRTTDLAAQL